MSDVLRTYFAVVGVACIAGALWLGSRRLQLLFSGSTTVGRIEAFEAREDDGSLFYLPIVSFTDKLGRAHRFTAVAGRSTQTPRIGSAVTVRYLRADPDTAFIMSFLHMWAAPLGLAVLGAGALWAYVAPA
ncbi:MAG: DUF3592 domain-containing protein [Candidatus Parcubacteria bacterium]|nr:DUF3592 domain-containing protein [Burkholderiales bacterium]